MKHKPTTQHTGALAAATLALAVSSAATAADDFQGIWRVTWENGDETELTIVGIDDQGRAVGAYCHQTNQGRTSYVDLHPDAILAHLDNTAARRAADRAPAAPLDVPPRRRRREPAIPIPAEEAARDRPRPRRRADVRPLGFTSSPLPRA